MNKYEHINWYTFSDLAIRGTDYLLNIFSQLII